MILTLRILVGAFLWLLPIPIKLIMVAAGYVVIPLAVLFNLYQKTDDNLDKPDDGPIYHFTEWWLYPWDNWSDGIANNNYIKFDHVWQRVLYWSMIRNPANNLRTLPITSVKLDSSKIGFIGSDRPISKYKDRTPHWFFCWQGLYTSFFIQFNFAGQLQRFWVGYKIIPQDTLGVELGGYRERGAVFTIQFKRIKEDI